MNDDQFTKLFKYMQQEFAGVRSEMRENFQHVDERFDHIYSVLDSILKHLEPHDQELLIINYQLERHENWIGQLAENTQARLTPGL